MRSTFIPYFPKEIWVIFIGTFLTRACFFMIWPFITILMRNNYAMTPVEIGVMMSVSLIVSISFGYLFGGASDKYGRRTLIILGAIAAIISFSVLALANSPAWYFVGILLNGISRSLIEPASKAVIGDILHDRQERERALNIRYFLMNVGAAVGPLAGVALGLTAQKATFFVTALSFLCYLLLVLAVFKAGHGKETRNATFSFIGSLRIIWNDQAFKVLVVANILVMLVYGQIDVTLPQYLMISQVHNPEYLLSVLIFINAATVITLQYFTERFTRRMSLALKTSLGVFFLGLSQIVFLLVSSESWGLWLVAMFLLSLGEVILFPTLNIQIDRMAPANLKGAYFGAATFYEFGLALAPFVGGLLLKQGGGGALYAVMFFLCIGVIVLYTISERISEKRTITA
ncbi:TPA: MDR family MFS transporter [Serratia marcescens]